MKKIILLAMLFATMTFGQSTFYFLFDEDREAPAAPTSPSALGSAGSVAVSWTDPTALDCDSIRVYAGTSTAPTTWVASVVKGTQTYNYTGLTPGGTIYYFRLKAKDQTGNLSAYTSTVQDTVLPVVPTIAVVGGVDKITITNTAIIADSLRIYRGTETDPTTWVFSMAANSTKIDSAHSYGTIYYYRAKALTGSTLSDYSTSVSGTILVNLGNELVANGDFPDGSEASWPGISGGNWSLSGGKANHTSTQDFIVSTTGMVASDYYRLVYTVSNFAGDWARVGGNNDWIEGQRIADGTYTTDFSYTQGSDGKIYISAIGDLSVDNVSLKEILNP